MTYPKVDDNARICLAVKDDGVTAYGNKEGFKTLANWLTWIAESDPSEHYECHLGWSFDSATKEKVWPLFSDELKRVYGLNSTDKQNFELTFMAVEDSDLDELEKSRESMNLPESYNSE